MSELANQPEANNLNEVTHVPNVCTPIKTLAELWAYLKSPPEWIKSVISLKSRSDYVIKNEPNDCHVEEFKFIPKMRYNKRFVPKTLICHDMKNGYLADKYVGGINIGNGYSFYRWSQIDIFVYFSHHFVTIPPLSWINLSHKNGVPILGTLITEWNEGFEICNKILKDEATLKLVADALVDLCVMFKFDGWLLNIENFVDYTSNLILFVEYLTSKLHEKVAWGKVIWYDSVTKDGELRWQNELNELNHCYFDVCDGIFLNYTWNEHNLKRSVKKAGHRILDVYVGLDVFGRGSFGGGQFNSYIAAEVVRRYNLSLAIFGQGWTHETLSVEPENNFLERYYARDSVLWKSLWPYLYTHPSKYAFTTYFDSGVDSNKYNIEKQDVQLSFYPSHHPTVETKLIDLTKSICSCVRDRLEDNRRGCLITNKDLNEENPTHRLFTTEILLFNPVFVFLYTLQSRDVVSYELILLVEDRFGRISKYVCCSDAGRADEKSSDVISVKPSRAGFIRDRDLPPNWECRFFEINFSEHKILEVGIRLVNGISLHLCGIGITTKTSK